MAVAARSADSPAPGPAQRSTNIGRRRLPPALSVERASPASASPCPSTSSASLASTLAIIAGSHDCAASITWVTGGGTAERFIQRYPLAGSVAQAPRTPEWIAMIPPARIV